MDARGKAAFLALAQTADGAKGLGEALEMAAEAAESGNYHLLEYAKRLETTDAQLTIASNNFQSLGQVIGEAFLPLINFFLPIIIGQLNNTTQAIRILIEMFKIGFISISAIIALFIEWVSKVGPTIRYTFQKVWKDMLSDASKMIGKLGNILPLGLSEITDTLSNKLQEMSDNVDPVEVDMSVSDFIISDAFDKIMEGWDNIKLASDKAGDSFDLAENLNNTRDLLEKLKKPLDNLGDGKLKKEIDKATESFKKFALEGKNSLNEVAGKISDLATKMLDLGFNRNKERRGINEEYAQAYLDQEKRVADAQAAFNSEEDTDAKAAAQKLLTTETNRLEKYGWLAKKYASDVKYLREEAEKSEIQRTIDDLYKKQVLLEEEYTGKRNAVQAELDAEVSKYKEIQKLYQLGLEDAKEFNSLSEKATVDSVNKQIDYYNELADAISKAKSGQKSSAVNYTKLNRDLEFIGSEIENPSIVNNYNVTGNTIMSASELENMLNQTVMRTAGDNVKLP